MLTKNLISVIGILTTLIFYPIAGSGQERKVLITATVVDSVNHQPLQFITVSLNTAQKVFVSQVLTKTDGTFQFSAARPAAYRISFSAIGYVTKTIEVKSSDSTAISLKTISLLPATTALATVNIAANKPLVKQEIDRLSYDLQADPESKASSLLEMMRKVPMLSVDGNDNLELKGSSSYKILINGKPSAMMERNLKEVLRSMPASTIQKIEVITTPPSRYDAEGLAGIINIVTHKKIPAGYSGAVNLNATTPTGGPGGGASLSARTGKLGLTTFGGGGIYNTPATVDAIERLTNNTVLSQQNEKQKDSRSAYFGTEISYEIDSLHLLSASLNLSGSNEHRVASQLSHQTGQILQQYLLDNTNDGNGNSRDATLNYQSASSRQKDRLLTLSYRYYAFGYHSQSRMGFSRRVNYTQPDFQQSDQGNVSEHTIQLDYMTKVGQLGIEAGVKAIFRNNRSDFLYLTQNVMSGISEADPLRSNRFDNTQDVYAAYNSYQFRLGSIEIKAGARLEYTGIIANFRSSQRAVSAQQLNLLPAIVVSRRLNPSSTLSLGFTQRIQRPGIYQLNPFVDRSNPNVESSGNPDLRPVIANGIQLTYSLQRKAFLNISLDYTGFNSLINQVAAYNESTNITRISYQNTGTAKLISANISLNYPITKKLSLSTNSKLLQGHIQGFSGNSPISTGGFMYAVGWNGGYKFDQGWRVNASVNHKSRSFTLQREMNAITSSSFSVSKELTAAKLNFSLSVNNPFNKYRSDTKLLTGPGFEQTTSDHPYFRSFKLSLNYNFGKLSQAVKKSTRSIRNDDVSN